MAGLTDNVGLLFKIKADATDAIHDLNKVQGEVKGLGAAGILASSGIASMINPATLAATGIAAMGAAAVAGVAAIARLTVAASEFGSKLFDASIQTGLNAESLSALKLAADTSGSSLESISGAVSKFNVLLGQAANGNEKAQKVLEQYGITATDAGEALEQAFNAVDEATNKNVASAQLFKDKTGQLIPVIDAMGGSLRKATEDAKKLGLTFTEDDIKAADEFGDTLDILGKQAAAAGQKFAFELMPNATHAMQSMSSSAAENTDAFRDWGRYVGDIIRGVELSFLSVKTIAEVSLGAINSAFGTNIKVVFDWASIVIGQFGLVGQAIVGLRALGAAYPLDAKAGAKIGGQFGGGAISLPGGSGGGGGGRGGGGAGAKVDSDYERAVKNQKFLIDAFKDGADSAMAENDRKLAYLEITEAEHLAEVARLKRFEIQYEIELINDLLAIARISAKEREEAERNLASLKTKLHTQETKNATDRRKQESKDLDDASADIAAFEQLKEEVHQRELARIEKERKAKNERDKKQAQLDADASMKALRDKENQAEGSTLRSGGFAGGILGAIGIMGDATLNARDKAAAAAHGIKASWGSMKDSVMSGIDSMVQGLGAMVESWVLYGSVGPNAIKKMVAATLAGVAAQASVLAIFELAKGFASLIWNPAEAAAHFTAAALFGSIAIGTALGGRAIAGDSFAQSTAGGGATASDGPTDQQNNFSSGRFGGFQQAQTAAMNRLNQTVAVFEETAHHLMTKITSFSPGDVVGRAADDNPRAFTRGLTNDLNESGSFPTGGIMRSLGTV